MFIVSAIVGVLGAMLPARWWPWLDRYGPASGSAVAAGVLTTLLGGVVGILGFVDYAQGIAGALNDVAMNTPGVSKGPDDFSSLTLQAISGVSAFGFFMTPRGVLAMYLLLTGLVRALGATFVEPSGDPVLTWVDHVVHKLRATIVAGREDRARTSLEGPEVPDGVVRGDTLQIDADLVIVSARRKPGWDQGTIVRSGERWFRLGRIEERTFGGRLRTLYPLTELRDHGVIRRLVEYDFPGDIEKL